MKKIYFAGGCFWGVEKFMSLIQGVKNAVSGYANGTKEDPTYEEVCSGRYNFRECVEVEYDSISLETLLFAFFRIINPEQADGQANDIGSQYLTGIYFIDEESEKIVNKVVEVERKRHKNFFVEIKYLENFYRAEDYHQDYLSKNPGGYCHINSKMFDLAKNLRVEAKYDLESQLSLKKRLTNIEYDVTQNAYTERPFVNEYFDFDKEGLYVDVVTNEPLFSSRDKFKSSCGWPAFSKPVDPSVVVDRMDYSHNMERVEVLSRSGNSHLGHVFENDPESSNGIRYCINSAALKFIPYDELDDELKKLV